MSDYEKLTDRAAITRRGYESGLAGDPCDPPTDSEDDMETWIYGWKQGTKHREFYALMALEARS